MNSLKRNPKFSPNTVIRTDESPNHNNHEQMMEKVKKAMARYVVNLILRLFIVFVVNISL
jgi:hypothetical protein